MKVWKLPNTVANARGKAFVNLLPLEPGDRITTVLPLPEDEAAWERLDVMFATSSGDVRRNKLSDFVQVNRAGKIAMKLGEGEHILGVQLATQDQDVLLTTASGRCIRFAVSDVRVFQSRESTGVRGVRLAAGDAVISMAMLRHVEAGPAERAVYLRQSAAARAAIGDIDAEAVEAEAAEIEAEEGVEVEAPLSPERYAQLGAAEQFILTVTDNGYGKRTSAYDYRLTGRGGQGLIAHNLTGRGGRLAASFPVEESDELLRTASTRGVTIFRTDGERVVSVERLEGEGGAADDGAA